MKNTLPKARVRGAEILAILTFLTLVMALPADARDCGGRKACGCGDKVVRDHILTRSIGPCPGVGLRMGAGVTLDGNGEAIRGSGTEAGVIFDEKAIGAVVRNLEVSGFKRGIRFAGVRGARLENVQSHHNGDRTTAVGYGVDLARGASENILIGLRVFENADEGIHFGTGANRNRLEDSEVFDNYRENIYFLQNQGNEVHRSKIHGGGAAAFYIKHAPDTVLVNNQISDRPVQLRGRSDRVRLVDNRLKKSTVNLEPFKGDVPEGVRIMGGHIEASGHACVRLRGARKVWVENVAFSCRGSVSVEQGADVRVTLDSFSQARCEGTGTVTRLGHLEQHFVDAQGAGVAGVTLLDDQGVSWAQSSKDGTVERLLPLATLSCPRREMSSTGLRASLGSWSKLLNLGAGKVVLVPSSPAPADQG